MDIINAVKRLERAGDENSKATKKLHQAAATIAELIEKTVPVGIKLPRGYKVIRVRSNIGSDVFLGHDFRDNMYTDWPETWIDGIGRYLHNDFNCNIPAQTRAGSLKFAKDIAEGLLDEIAEFLEQRKAEADQATIVLEQAAEKLNG
jgi:hypothetical protein